jgi:type III secretion protein U
VSDEKTEKPTSQKLKKARQKGEVFKSTDVIQTAVFGALVLLGLVGTLLYLPRLADILKSWPHWMERLVQTRRSDLADGNDVLAVFAALERSTNALLMALLPLFLVVAAVGLAAAWMQVKAVFTFVPLTPKMDRMNPGPNLKKLFSVKGLIDVVKTLLKVLMVGSVVVSIIRGAVPQWQRAVYDGTALQLSELLGSQLLLMAMGCLAIYLFMSGLDYGHQYFEYMKNQRMSKDEVRREYKDMEGDPHIRGQRKALQRAMATQGPAAGVAQANAVVTNPTHLSVALAYTPGSGTAPRVVAKGEGDAALEIRRAAKKLGIPIQENKPLARRLYAKVAVNAPITPELYRDTATFLAGVMRPRKPEEGSTRVGAV